MTNRFKIPKGCVSGPFRGSPSRVFRRHITWWRNQMETFSALLAICAGNSPVPVNSPHKGQWRVALMFSLICARINDWVNNREAGDLRRYRGHYDVIVMIRIKSASVYNHSIVCIDIFLHHLGFELCRKIYAVHIQITHHFEMKWTKLVSRTAKR